jgi:twitching motility protein PilI
MLELEPLNYNTQQYNIAIAKVGDRAIALAVQAIKGVQRLTIDVLQSPVGYVSPGLVPYLQSCVLQQEQVLLVLETQAIISSPLLPRE